MQIIENLYCIHVVKSKRKERKHKKKKLDNLDSQKRKFKLEKKVH